MNTSTPSTERLEYLRKMLTEYSEAYHRANKTGRDMSARMMGWIDEYDSLRHTPEWYAYCTKLDFSTSHNSYDLFA